MLDKIIDSLYGFWYTIIDYRLYSALVFFAISISVFGFYSLYFEQTLPEPLTSITENNIPENASGSNLIETPKNILDEEISPKENTVNTLGPQIPSDDNKALSNSSITQENPNIFQRIIRTITGKESQNLSTGDPQNSTIPTIKENISGEKSELQSEQNTNPEQILSIKEQILAANAVKNIQEEEIIPINQTDISLREQDRSIIQQENISQTRKDIADNKDTTDNIKNTSILSPDAPESNTINQNVSSPTSVSNTVLQPNEESNKEASEDMNLLDTSLPSSSQGEIPLDASTQPVGGQTLIPESNPSTPTSTLSPAGETDTGDTPPINPNGETITPGSSSNNSSESSPEGEPSTNNSTDISLDPSTDTNTPISPTSTSSSAEETIPENTPIQEVSDTSVTSPEISTTPDSSGGTSSPSNSTGVIPANNNGGTTPGNTGADGSPVETIVDQYFENNGVFDTGGGNFVPIRVIAVHSRSPIRPIPASCPSGYDSFGINSNVFDNTTIPLPYTTNGNNMSLSNEFISKDGSDYYFKIYNVNGVKIGGVIYKVGNPDVDYHWAFTVCLNQ